MYWFLCSSDQLQLLNASYVGFVLFVKVQDSSDVINEGRVRVVFSVPCEPQLDALILNQHVSLGSVKKSAQYTLLYTTFFSSSVYFTYILIFTTVHLAWVCLCFQILSFVFVQKYSVKYSPGYVLASRLGITNYLVSRFSGSIFIGRGSKKK